MQLLKDYIPQAPFRPGVTKSLNTGQEDRRQNAVSDFQDKDSPVRGAALTGTNTPLVLPLPSAASMECGGNGQNSSSHVGL